MEAANLIQKLHLKPKRTIRVIAWMNEENGRPDRRQYAKDHEKEWTNHFAAMETDGGAGHPIGINIKAKPEVKKMFAPVAAILQESGAGMLNLVEHCGADIEPMEKAGVPAFSPIQDSRFYFNYHHTAADTLDKIVPKELAENSAVVAVARVCAREHGATVASLSCIPVRYVEALRGVATRGGRYSAVVRYPLAMPPNGASNCAAR